MPGTAAGTCRRKHRSVAVATSCTEAGWAQSLPAMTMLGLSSMASSEIRCSKRAWNTAWRTMLVTSSQRSMECDPSISTSGSTIGTRPPS